MILFNIQIHHDGCLDHTAKIVSKCLSLQIVWVEIKILQFCNDTLICPEKKISSKVSLSFDTDRGPKINALVH